MAIKLWLMLIGLLVYSNISIAEIVTNMIDDPDNSAIDFSNATPGPNGIVCIQRHTYNDRKELDQIRECWLQNVTQCHFTYVTEYSDGETQKCEDFYWKTCKILFKEHVYNHTSRSCKRPLVKKCNDDDDDDGNDDEYGFRNSRGNLKIKPTIVCETFYEVECNTTLIQPEAADEPLPYTFCDRIPRKICAADNCRVVEDKEVCETSDVVSTIEQPVELCHLQPQKYCRKTKISVPHLRPERKCRPVEKEVCHTRLVNPHDLKLPVIVRYCTKKEAISPRKLFQSSYLPPQPPVARFPVATAQPYHRFSRPTAREKREHESTHDNGENLPWRQEQPLSLPNSNSPSTIEKELMQRGLDLETN